MVESALGHTPLAPEVSLGHDPPLTWSAGGCVPAVARLRKTVQRLEGGGLGAPVLADAHVCLSLRCPNFYRLATTAAITNTLNKYSYETYEDKVEGGKRFQVNSLF